MRLRHFDYDPKIFEHFRQLPSFPRVARCGLRLQLALVLLGAGGLLVQHARGENVQGTLVVATLAAIFVSGEFLKHYAIERVTWWWGGFVSYIYAAVGIAGLQVAMGSLHPIGMGANAIVALVLAPLLLPAYLAGAMLLARAADLDRRSALRTRRLRNEEVPDPPK